MQAGTISLTLSLPLVCGDQIIDLPSSDGAAVAERLGANAIFAPTDITSEEQVIAALDATEKEFGRNADAVVNCAGIGAAMKTVGKKGAHSLNVFQVNCSCCECHF